MAITEAPKPFELKQMPDKKTLERFLTGLLGLGPVEVVFSHNEGQLVDLTAPKQPNAPKPTDTRS